MEGDTGRCGTPTGLLVGEQWDLLWVWSIDYEVAGQAERVNDFPNGEWAR